MRITITIPDETYKTAKVDYKNYGYVTFSEYVCNLLKSTSSGAVKQNKPAEVHHKAEIDSDEVHHKIQNAAQAKQAVKIIKAVGLCEHGSMPQLCKHNKCREAYNKAH